VNDPAALTMSRSPRRRGRRLRCDLRVSIGDGAAFGGMVGFGETYLPAFALAIGLGELSSGLVASLPLAAGGVMQLISPACVQRLGSHKRWVLLCAIIQALTFVPLVIAAYAGRIGLALLLAIAAVYWAAGLAAGPAWNMWIGTLVPPPLRPRFFAVRTRASQALVMVGIVAGGLVLQSARTGGDALLAFLAVFAIAGGCRLVSAGFLAWQSEPVPLPAEMRSITWRELIVELRDSGGGRLLVYLVAVQAAVQIAGPFFTPFMLEQLKFDYLQFVALLAIGFLSKVAALTGWGQFAHRHGARQLLWIGAVGIAPISAGWLISQNFWWLMVVQLVGGITWAAYELAFFLMFFDSIPERDRTSLLTLYNFLNTTAWVVGSLLGGVLLFVAGATYFGYLLVFAVSAMGRCLALILLTRVSHYDVPATDIAVRTIAVRPGMASLDAPVLSSLENEHATEAP